MSQLFVYILESESLPGRFYTGIMTDVFARLVKHNKGGCDSTRDARPWRVRTAVTFDDASRARAFERYLKSGSGRAFAKRHF